MSKILKKKWEERAYQQHVQKIQAVKGGVDHKAPKRFPHLDVKVTKTRKEEERLAEVNYQNQLLVHKLTGIMGRRSSYDSLSENQKKRYMPAHNLNIRKREKESERIYKSNQEIARRLEAVRPVISIRDHEESYRKHREYKKLRGEKPYNEYMSERDRDMPPLQRSRSLDGSDDLFYDYSTTMPENLDDDGKSDPDQDNGDEEEGRVSESDYAYLYSDDEDDNMPEEKWRKFQKKPQPQLQNSSGQAVKLPKIEKRDYFGMVQQENELIVAARSLYTACKFTSKQEETITKSLLRKLYQTRLQIKKKFKQTYSQNLEEELKKVTSISIHPFISALLITRGGPEEAEELEAALTGGNVPRLMQIFCTRKKPSLISLQNSYKSRYMKTVDTTLAESITDADVQALLHLLLHKDGRHDDTRIDDVLAKNDARKLNIAGKGKWTDEDGPFMKIVSSRSYAQIGSTLVGFRAVTGRNLWEVIEEDVSCSSEYTKAIKAFCNLMVDKEGVTASQLRLSISNPERFIKMMVLASDRDLPPVKEAYKQKYGVELETDIRYKYRAEQARMLLELCEKKPARKVKPRARDSVSFPLPVKGKPRNTAGASDPPQDYSDLLRFDSPSPPPSPKDDDSKPRSDKAVRWEDTDSLSTARTEPAGSSQWPLEETSTSEDCERLYEAMCGFGTDEDVITDILAKRSNAQRQLIREKYEEVYDKKLISDLKSELSGDYEEIILALVMRPAEYFAHSLHHDIEEAEMEGDTLASLIHTAGEKDDIKHEYEKAYGADLIEELKERGSGDFKDVMLALFDPSSSEEAETEKLDKLVWSMNEDVPSHFVQLVQTCFDGFGTDERPLIRIIVSRSEIDLGAIKNKYRERYGKSLEDALKDETRGDFKDCLLALVRNS